MIFLENYLILFFFIFISLLISLIVFFLSFFLDFFLYNLDYNFEKFSAYECGFQPFSSDSRESFKVKFYLVGILFLIFDLEITYLVPWVILFSKLTLVAFFTMLVFFLFLLVGFAYEWLKGGMDW